MKYCYQCNEPLKEKSVFCSNCGKKVIEDKTQEQIPLPQKKTNVCAILAIIFGTIGMIPLLNFLFLPISIVLGIIGLTTSKNKKKGVTIASTVVVSISLVISIIWISPIFWGNSVNDTNNSTISTKPQLTYTEIYEGGEIDTDFVKLTIEDISLGTTIKSINKNKGTVFNAESGEHFLYITGNLTNTSYYTYDVGSLGSASYGNTDCVFDCNLYMENGERIYGVLLTDNGSFYGLSSDGRLSPQETVKYYFVFQVGATTNTSGKITLAFTDDFNEKPSYDHSNCEYLYQINID